MRNEDIRRRIDDVIMRFTRTLPKNLRITDESSLRDDLRIDSADMVEIALELEEQFKISVPEEAMNRLETVGQMVRMVEASVSTAATAAG
jgi:acyl carrier protein